ncbi:MAG TPA: 5-methyltetrahydropteroyltriglutamate--homocysteine S-methyltransferase, partial [Verrucomicrobiae bacterium]|nr:5-methyltetrahydropteroyltriglutamate--homocysteine S-methyltransferase [Verrucomicrobiae bacterium]
MPAELRTSVLGFPRIGLHRELKKALESFWKGEIGEAELEEAGRKIRGENWRGQKNAGIDVIASNDFSFYDHVLDTIALTGCVPARYGWRGGRVDLAVYFAMARGGQAPALEMTKWFDTNYHYLVPELSEDQDFSLASDKVFREFSEAKALGILTRPVLVGPVTFLLLAKTTAPGFSALSLLPKLLPVYAEVLKKLGTLGAASVRFDEPALALDLGPEARQAFQNAYRFLAPQAGNLELWAASYFGAYGDNTDLACSLPVHGLHADLVRGAGDLPALLKKLPAGKKLSAGLVDGRNIWRTDLDAASRTLAEILAAGPREVEIASACSLLHVPLDAEGESKLDPAIQGSLAFARQKLAELDALKKISQKAPEASRLLSEGREALARRRAHPAVSDPKVRKRLASVTEGDFRRKSA